MRRKPAATTDQQAEQLATTVAPILDELAWGQSRLEAETAGALSQQRLSNWLGTKTRVPSRDDCTAIAATLIGGLMRKNRAVPDQAYRTLQNVFHGAGYSLSDTPEEPDIVWRRIRQREQTGSPTQGPVVGIVPWQPFSLGEDSVASDLAKSVLGSLDPSWNRDVHIRFEQDFASAEAHLLGRDPERPDLLLGLYDIPWRRREGLDLIPLPGLRVALGALSSSKTMKWSDILNPQRGAAAPHAYVLRGDIGDRLLTGPVDYPAASITKLDQAENSTVARRLQRQIESEAGFIFVADGPVVHEVYNLLGDSGFESRVHEIKDPVSEPTFRFGFALPQTAGDFSRLLRAAISEDLFGPALPRTVALYLKLLRSGPSEMTRLSLADLEVLGPDVGLRFLRIAHNLDPESNLKFLEGVVTYYPKLEQFFAEARRQWPSARPATV